jgi:hypothetical protein
MSCVQNYFLFGSSCNFSCPPGYQGDVSNWTCVICPGGVCTKCQGDSSKPYLFNGITCVATCPDGTYTEHSDNTCRYCLSNCGLCTLSTNCSRCNLGYFLINNTCLPTCGNGYANDKRNPDLWVCTLCETTC